MSNAKRPITAEDLKRINYLQDPQFSPDGEAIAFVKVTPDSRERTYKRNIWLYLRDTRETRQITRSDYDSQPRWSPDGTQLAFVSSRGGDKPQIYLLPTATPGGEARQLSALENGCHSPCWSPDGKRIAFLSPVSGDERNLEETQQEEPCEPKDKLDSRHRKERKAEDEASRWDPRPMWRIPFRYGTAYVDERYDQVYVMETAESSDSKPRRLTGINADYSAPYWSADGLSIFSARTTVPDGDEPWHAMNIYRLDVDTGEETALTDEEFSYSVPKPSPDGKWIACERSHIGITDLPTRLIVLATDGSEERVINESLDRMVLDWAWSLENVLACSVQSEGKVLPWLYDPDSDRLSPAHDGIYDIEQLDFGVGGAMAMTVSTPQNPQELYVLADGGFSEVTNFNHEWLAEVQVQPVHELRFDTPHGEVQGWYILPAKSETGKKAPLALNIHGGPHVPWGYSTKTMWHEWQFHAARGYAVFYCNPHGSGGYGGAFIRKLHADWGPVAMDDIMAGVEAFLRLGYADEDRMAITGGSYGGFMTAWIIGHTGRFKAAVAQRGVYNLSSFYGTSYLPLLISNEFDAEPWDDHDVYWNNSPLKYAASIKTPLLITHSENDFGVPIEQAEQLFAWVRRATNTPVSMLRYPARGARTRLVVANLNTASAA